MFCGGKIDRICTITTSGSSLCDEWWLCCFGECSQTRWVVNIIQCAIKSRPKCLLSKQKKKKDVRALNHKWRSHARISIFKITAENNIDLSHSIFFISMPTSFWKSICNIFAWHRFPTKQQQTLCKFKGEIFFLYLFTVKKKKTTANKIVLIIDCHTCSVSCLCKMIHK